MKTLLLLAIVGLTNTDPMKDELYLNMKRCYDQHDGLNSVARRPCRFICENWDEKLQRTTKTYFVKRMKESTCAKLY